MVMLSEASPEAGEAKHLSKVVKYPLFEILRLASGGI